jgi:hypothetical protein
VNFSCSCSCVCIQCLSIEKCSVDRFRLDVEEHTRRGRQGLNAMGGASEQLLAALYEMGSMNLVWSCEES